MRGVKSAGVLALVPGLASVCASGFTPTMRSGLGSALASGLGTVLVSRFAPAFASTALASSYDSEALDWTGQPSVQSRACLSSSLWPGLPRSLREGAGSRQSQDARIPESSPSL